jgi:hypothetical protein
VPADPSDDAAAKYPFQGSALGKGLGLGSQAVLALMGWHWTRRVGGNHFCGQGGTRI